MEDSVKRMRIEIVASGLDFLLTHSEGISRKQFFMTDPNAVKFDGKKLQLLAKANSSKDWQQKVLDRLISHHLIKKIEFTNGVGYQADNYDKVKLTCENFKSGDGLLVSYYVFPNEVPEPEVIPSIPDSPATTSTIDDCPIEIAVILEKILENIVALKSDHATSSKGTLETIKIFMNHLETSQKVFETSNSLEKENTTAFKALENRVNGFNKKIDDLSTTVKQQNTLMEANQRATKEILASAKSIDEVAFSLKTLGELVSCVEDLTTNVLNLTKQIKSKEENSLLEISRKLGSSIKEMSALQTEILNVTSEIGEAK
jgi:hypothetical protein